MPSRSRTGPRRAKTTRGKGRRRRRRKSRVLVNPPGTPLGKPKGTW
jgi:hypothetical protein